MEAYRILLPHQLFPRERIPEPKERVYVVDHEWLLEELPLNKLTLFHRLVSAGAYAREHSFHRAELRTGDTFLKVCQRIRREGGRELHMFDPLDAPLRRSIELACRRVKGLSLVFEDTPAFAETHEDLDRFLKEHPPKKRGGICRYSHAVFYQWQRRRLNLLMTPAGAPVGGKWTYDVENREPFPSSLTRDPPGAPLTKSGALPLPSSKIMSPATIKEIYDYIQTKFSKNPGVLPDTPEGTFKLAGALYPLTRKAALLRLQRFMKRMLPEFGPYEDAFRVGVSFGYHSVLSSSLNNGLLTPDDVIKAIKKHRTPSSGSLLASLEGFTRQVIGWRSYTRLVYREEREVMLRSNYLGNRRRLSREWFQGEAPPSVGMEWMDALLRDAYRVGYAHHIVRLMVFSNWFLLMGYHPRDVLRWFSSVVSIDAYEWVMVPNVMGMGQFADGGIMMQRPYVSASAYLNAMGGVSPMTSSTGNQGSPEDARKMERRGLGGTRGPPPWDALYYSFLMRHEGKLGKMYAYSRSYAYLRKVPATKKAEWREVAKEYMKTYG
jgi:deoxyribodipyrimidine photolyase-related protein